MERAAITSARARWGAAALLFAIVAVALALRLNGLDWDGGALYHPDERSIFLRADLMHRTLIDAPGWEASANRDFPLDEPGMPGLGTLLDAERSPLNPHWFPLGSVIIYILVAVRFLLEPFMEQVRLQDLASAGRTMAALADVGSLVMLYLLGRRLFGRGTGLLAMALGAFAAIFIQVAHFYRPEPFVALLALIAFWHMLNVAERGRRRDHIALGLVVGLSFAFRSTSLPLLVPLALTYGALVYRALADVIVGSKSHELGRAATRGAMAAAVAIAVFAALQPYALLDIQKFVGDQGFEAMVARTAGAVPYTVQYVGERFTLYEVRQSAVWGLGLPLGIAAWAGLALSVVRVLGRRRWGTPRWGEALLVAWAAPFLLGLALFEVKFLRYLTPVLPVMVLLGARWLVTAAGLEAPPRLARHQALLRRAAFATAAFVVVATMFYGAAFARSYNEPHPAIAASAYLNETAAPGSLVLTDNHWDEGFADLGRFRVDQARIYESDTPAKVSELADQLAAADYLIAYSNRPFGSVARLPERYPYSSAYYRLLFDGELGFELERAFERYPTLLGVAFAHDPFTRAGVTRPQSLPGVEEAPLTLQLGYADGNVTNYDRPLTLLWRNEGRLTAREILSRIYAELDEPRPERLMLSEAALDQQRAGGTWSEIFSEGGLNGAAPWLAWLLAVELIFVLTLPLAYAVFRWLPDRGIVLARPLGLLLVAWLAWLGASYGVWHFGRGSAVLSMVGVGLLSAWPAWRYRAELLTHLRRRWRYLLSMEALFLASFFVFLAVRAANPDLWHPWRGGEKPMDLSYLTAVARSSVFPPYDPWYAGGFINYYYFGFVIIAALMRLTGIVPAIAYNLAVPLLFALTLTATFSAGHNLAEALRQRARLRVRARSTAAAGLAAMLLLGVLGNLDGAAQLVQGAWASLNGESFDRFDFWRSSRVMVGQISITEFPFWTFLFADLHAHMIAIPFGLLAVGGALNVALSGRSPVGLRRRAPALGVLALTVGSLAAINTWDVAPYGLLALAATAIMVATARGGADALSVALRWLLISAAFWGAVYLLWLPYHQHYEPTFGGLERSQWQTVLWHYLAIHALLLFAAGSWLAVEARRRLRPGARLASAGAALLLAVVIAAAASSAVRPWTTALLLGLIALAALALSGWWLARRRRPEAPVQLVLLAMLGIALGVGIGVDAVTIANDIDRMNTVFKLYIGGWALFALVGGVGLWSLWSGGALSLRRPAGIVWACLLALLVLSASVYPLLGTRARLADRFGPTALTLDGAAFQREYAYTDQGPDDSANYPNARYDLAHDAEALDFLRRNVTGSPVVLEAVTAGYRWTPRVAVYTGLPVVVGWEWHQVQQRGAGGAEPDRVRRRIQDVRTIYGTTDAEQALRLMERYGVAYVYVGPAERLYFAPEGLAKFEEMVGSALERVYKGGPVTVYRVLPRGRGAPP